MTLIALTGGIASGKSTIGRRFEELGATRIDADVLARQAVEVGSPGLARVREQFGDEIMSGDGSLDRQALGAKVFGAPEQLERLNDIVHPAVRALAAERIAEARARDPRGVIVYEIPLLVETGLDGEWDLIVVADAPEAQRIQRLREYREMSESESRRRVRSQASDAERRAVADVLIDTSGTLVSTLEQVDALWERITGASAPADDDVRDG